jgi:pyruvate,water dikinase
MRGSDDGTAAGGGKAAGLRRLRRAGFRVPPWVLLEAGLFDQLTVELVLAAKEFSALTEPAEALARGAELRAAIRAADLPPAVTDRIAAAHAELGGVPVAVRSSGEAEDGAAHSFAGQFDSFLNCRDAAEIGAAVRDCWASAFAERVIRYAFAHGLPLPRVPAVLVQRLVPARVSGVLFTADPATGSPGELVIGAVYGLGEGLVSGAVDADSVVVDKASGAVLSTVPGEKATAYRPASGGGCAAVEVAAELRAAAALNPTETADLVALGRRAETAFGAPQDIEWALDDAGLWVLQARPITRRSCPRYAAPARSCAPASCGSGTTPTSSRASAAAPRR